MMTTMGAELGSERLLARFSHRLGGILRPRAISASGVRFRFPGDATESERLEGTGPRRTPGRDRALGAALRMSMTIQEYIQL